MLDNQQDLPLENSIDNHVTGEGTATVVKEGVHNAHNNHHPPIYGEPPSVGQGTSIPSGITPPVPAPRTSRQKPSSIPLAAGVSSLPDRTATGSSIEESSVVKVRVTDADFDMDESIHLPPGAEYIPSIRKFNPCLFTSP